MTDEELKNLVASLAIDRKETSAYGIGIVKQVGDGVEIKAEKLKVY